MTGASIRMRAVRWLRSAVKGIVRARTFGLAAEMSFWLFLALVPLAAVAGLVVARVAMSEMGIFGSLLSSVPPSVQALIAEQVERVAAWHGRTVAPAAAALFVWLASTGVHAMFDALEVQSATSRPWWKKRLLAIATCIALSVGVAFWALCASGIDRVQPLAGRTLPALLGAAHRPVVQAVRWLVFVIVAVAIVAGIYRVGIPRRTGTRHVVLPGAILTVALQLGLGRSYGLYIAKVGNGDAYQAGLAAVGLTLMTVWLFSVSLLLGVQLNVSWAGSGAGSVGRLLEEAKGRNRKNSRDAK
jgi:membrane protein